jgi:hypothetical protein
MVVGNAPEHPAFRGKLLARLSQLDLGFENLAPFEI